jgi:CheY-like chemotaxis protein
MARKPETFFEEMKRYVGFTDEDRQRLRAASGAHACLEKPICDPQVLISKVQTVMGS